jgi:hypothetical protein
MSEQDEVFRAFEEVLEHVKWTPATQEAWERLPEALKMEVQRHRSILPRKQGAMPWEDSDE